MIKQSPHISPSSENDNSRNVLQDVFATPGSPASAQARSASKSGAAGRGSRSAGRRAAPASTADKDGERSPGAGRKRAAPASASADAEGADSGARAKRSRLAPISTEAEVGEAVPDQTPVPAPGSPAAHTRSHDHVRTIPLALRFKREHFRAFEPDRGASEPFLYHDA